MKIVAKRKLWFSISLVAIIISVVALFTLKLNTGIDFTSGTLFSMRFGSSVTADQINSFLNDEQFADMKLGKAMVQGIGENEFSIRVPALSNEDQDKFVTAFNEEFSDVTMMGVDLVDARIGSELTKNALYSVLLACVGILIYIGFRFQFSFAVAGVLALVHDVVITLGVFAISRQQINSAFIAAMLTIVGYSINNTIIIFDRIRENLKRGKIKDDAEIVDVSISETLTRTMNTSITTFIVVLMLFIFGASSIRDFTLAMLTGIIVGTYSSLLIAGPLWYVIKTSFGKKKAVSKSSK